MSALEAHYGRLKALLELSKKGDLSISQKQMFHMDLEIIIAAGVEKVEEKILSWAYNLRAEVYSGKHPNACAK